MNETRSCHSERSEESASRKCSGEKQIPRATASLGMTPSGPFPGPAQFPLIFFQWLLLFLCVLCAPASVTSASNPFLPMVSASVVGAQHAAPLQPGLQTSVQIPEWCKQLPRPEYKSLQRVLPDDPWFEVYKVAPGVLPSTSRIKRKKPFPISSSATNRPCSSTPEWASATFVKSRR